MGERATAKYVSRGPFVSWSLGDERMSHPFLAVRDGTSGRSHRYLLTRRESYSKAQQEGTLEGRRTTLQALDMNPHIESSAHMPRNAHASTILLKVLNLSSLPRILVVRQLTPLVITSQSPQANAIPVC